MGNTKYDALMFTKSLLQDSKETVRKEPFEPPSKLIPFNEDEALSSILDYLILEMSRGRLFVQRINNTPIYDASQGAYRSMSKGTHRGFPDIICLKDGRIIFFEVKSSIGVQKPDQVEMQELLEAQGGEYYIVRSINFVIKALNGY